MTAKPLAAVVWVVVVGALSTPTPVRGLALPIVTGVEPQPFIAQAMRLVETLEFLGSGIPESDARRLAQLRDASPTETVVEEMQRILLRPGATRDGRSYVSEGRSHPPWTSR